MQTEQQLRCCTIFSKKAHEKKTLTKGKMNSFIQFDLAEVVDTLLSPDDFALPLCLRRLILEFSGHMRIGTRSYIYVFYP
jgi:hypothetical protein